MFIWILIVVVVLSTEVCWFLAKRKGLSVQFWIVMGALFGPFAIPFALLAKSRAAAD